MQFCGGYLLWCILILPADPCDPYIVTLYASGPGGVTYNWSNGTAGSPVTAQPGNGAVVGSNNSYTESTWRSYYMLAKFSKRLRGIC